MSLCTDLFVVDSAKLIFPHKTAHYSVRGSDVIIKENVNTEDT